MSASAFRVATEGVGPISESLTVPAGANYKLECITLHLNDAPTTSENFTVTWNMVEGANYDALIYSVDLAAGSVTDVLWQADNPPLPLRGGDSIDVAWVNSDGRTWGLTISAEAV